MVPPTRPSDRFHRDHFAKGLKGTSIALVDVLQSERERIVVAAQDNAFIVRTIEAIPDEQYVVPRHAAAKADKWHGGELST